MAKVITPVRKGGSKKPYPAAAKNAKAKPARPHDLVEIKSPGKVGFTKG